MEKLGYKEELVGERSSPALLPPVLGKGASPLYLRCARKPLYMELYERDSIPLKLSQIQKGDILTLENRVTF